MFESVKHLHMNSTVEAVLALLIGIFCMFCNTAVANAIELENGRAFQKALDSNDQYESNYDDWIDEEELSVEELYRNEGLEPPAELYEEAPSIIVPGGIGESNALANDDDYIATAAFARANRGSNITGCMQNFAIFKQGGTSYMLASMSGGDTTTIVPLFRSDTTSKVYENFPVDSSIEYHGHGDSIEVLDYGGSKYALYVEYEEYIDDNGVSRKHFYVVCQEMTVSDTTSVTWGPKKRMKLIAASAGSYEVSCKICASDNYICVVSGYGTNLSNDREKFYVYNKKTYIGLLLKGNTQKNQNSMASALEGKGTFKGATQSIGFGVGLDRSVISSYELGESDDGTYVRVFASVHNRRSKSTSDDARTIHQINRATILLDGGASLQNMAANDCYYSKVVSAVYPGATVEKTQKLALPAGSENRMEFEGIKYVNAQGGGINGWYISVHSSRYNTKFVHADELKHGNFRDYAKSANVPWNMFIYKPAMTPTAKWSGN